jgi:hypothetical protein
MHRKVDIASLAAFRILFGAVMCFGLIRFLASGWIEPMYGEPRFFFHYAGFGWVHPWPVWGMYLHYTVLAVLALMIAAGFHHRLAALLFALGFAYTQLCDVTSYLNHHYLVVLLAVLLASLPANRAWSVDAWRRPALRADVIPAWTLWLLRFQVGVVYVFAGLAKAQPDWLVHAQPLNIWLAARTDTPLIGPWLDERWVAYAASWAGFLFDTTIVVWLSWRRTRVAAFVVVIGFHAATSFFFNIGMFPLIMTISATIFFSPSWPRRGPAPILSGELPAPPRRVVVALALWVAVQVVLPLRHHVYPGNVLWNEDGMRFAWQVMVREKHGAVTFLVRFPDGRSLEVPPSRYLTARQEREMSGQPDLIRQLADHIQRDFGGDVDVEISAMVSLNGRAPAPLFGPEPTAPPIHLRAIP